MNSERRLRILHILSQRPDSTGSGIYVQAMLREAARNGHANFLVAGIQTKRPPELTCIDDDDCRFVTFGGEDIPFIITGMSDVMPYESTRFRDLSPTDVDIYETAFSRCLNNAVAGFRPDIIHSHHLWILTALVRRLFPDIPLVTTCHGSDLRQFQNCPHLQQRVLPACRALDAVMALSHIQRETIANLYGIAPEAIHVVGAGYNDERFTRSTKSPADPVQVVYAGKLSQAKGVPWMLKAFSGIDQPAWHLHLVGGGSGEEKAQCLALANGLGNRVTIHGAVPQQRLAEIMQSCHLFVLPSLFEGLPLVILEALACGCRIVATHLPGVAELLGEICADFITLVPMPRLREVDKPLTEDEGRFTADLSEALRKQITAAHQHPQIDLTPIANRMAAFSWRGIFEKIEPIYLSHTSKGSARY